MAIEGYEFPDDLHYSTDHYWARQEDGLVVQGATDFAQKLAGDIVYVELPKVGRKIQQGKPFMSIESGKWVGRVYAVVSGEIVEANQELDDDPTLINCDPYGAGWIVKIRPNDSGEVGLPGGLESGKLMRSDTPQFREWLLAEIAKHKRS